MMQIVVFLPPPPGTSASSPDAGPSTLEVLAIVTVILGAVVLIAWLLKPLVAKRLLRHETVAQANADSAASRWDETWPRNSGTDDGREDATSSFDRLAPDLGDEPETLSTVPAEEFLALEHVTEPAPVEIESPEGVTEAPPVEDSNAADIVAIASTVRTLLERANTGRVREGFALYSEEALRRFRDEMGLTPDEFDAAFDEVPAPPPDQQAELAAITDVERLPDGRIRALVNYGNGGTSPPPEYFTFVLANGDGWLIDEIEAA
jgi:hypothetical protein